MLPLTKPTPTVRAEDYRAQGDSLLQQGRKAEALAAYQKAVTAYQEQKAAHPEQARALDNALVTVRAKMKLCE